MRRWLWWVNLHPQLGRRPKLGAGAPAFTALGVHHPVRYLLLHRGLQRGARQGGSCSNFYFLFFLKHMKRNTKEIQFFKYSYLYLQQAICCA